MRLRVPDKNNILITGDEDPAKFYYNFLTKRLFLKRLEIAIDLLDKKKKYSVLEIGYGCGILLLELSRHFRKVFAVDLHLNAAGVNSMLAKEGIGASLSVGDILNLPYKPMVFDSIICLSTLEHLSNLEKGIVEIDRIAKPGAQIIFGIPVSSLVMKLSFALLGYKFNKLHKWNDEQIIKAIKEKFTIEKIEGFPNLMFSRPLLYKALSCRKKECPYEH
jgi:ubiquinone/menaquinone biosynthesis C-methylase UbiE